MTTTITVEEVSTDLLSAKALALVSEFALILYRLEGIIIDVHEEDALYRVFNYVKQVTHDRLMEIAHELRLEISGKTAARATLDAISLTPQSVQRNFRHL